MTWVTQGYIACACTEIAAVGLQDPEIHTEMEAFIPQNLSTLLQTIKNTTKISTDKNPTTEIITSKHKKD